MEKRKPSRGRGEVASPEAKQSPDWERLEMLVANIQRQLAPGATITHNAKLPGLQSETTRQVDVLVEQNIGQYSIRVVLDCKDYAAPVDVKGVEEFHGLVVDVGAHKGALVCPAGFTKAAKKRARKLGIDLYSPADTDPHKWQVALAMPTICDFRSTGIAFGISCSVPVPLRLPADLASMRVYRADKSDMGTVIDVASRRWDDGEYPITPGDHERVPLSAEEVTQIDNGFGLLIPVSLTVSLRVSRQRYFGKVPIEKLHGLRDEHTGHVITNAFQFDLLDPVRIQNDWQKLADDELPPMPIALEVVGLHCWGQISSRSKAR